MPDIFLVPGVRTPFVKGGGPFAQYDALAISAPVAKAMAARARPDFVIWGEVIPDSTISNIARELIFAADQRQVQPAAADHARGLDHAHETGRAGEYGGEGRDGRFQARLEHQLAGDVGDGRLRDHLAPDNEVRSRARRHRLGDRG